MCAVITNEELIKCLCLLIGQDLDRPGGLDRILG